MKDEIKEIFDTKLYFDLDDEDYTKIQDYITNLQEERDMFERMSNWACKNMFAYKSKIDKANNILKDTSVDMPSTLLIETIDYARHILNGDNE